MDSIITEHKVVTFQSNENIDYWHVTRYYAYVLSGFRNNRVVSSRDASITIGIAKYRIMHETICIHSAIAIYLNQIE